MFILTDLNLKLNIKKMFSLYFQFSNLSFRPGVQTYQYISEISWFSYDDIIAICSDSRFGSWFLSIMLAGVTHETRAALLKVMLGWKFYAPN